MNNFDDNKQMNVLMMFSLMKYITIWHHFVTCAIMRVIFICNKDAEILNSRSNYYFLE